VIQSIIIQPSAKQTLISETLKFKKVETGGVLCGHYRGQHIIIEAVSGPGLKAIHSEIEFILDKDFMHTFLDREYSTSMGLNIFVGEWHTHPQVLPLPSPQDMQSIFERSCEWSHGDIVFLIIGFIRFSPEKLESQITGLYFDKEKGQFYQLPIIYNS